MEKTYRKNYFNVNENLKKPNLTHMLRLIKNNDDFENIYVILQIALINLNLNKPFSDRELVELLDNDDLTNDERKEIIKLIEQRRKEEHLKKENQNYNNKSTKEVVINGLKKELEKLIYDLISLPIEFWNERGAAEYSNKVLGYDIVPKSSEERSNCVFQFIRTVFNEVFNTRNTTIENRTDLIQAMNEYIKKSHEVSKSIDYSGKN